MKTQAYRRRFYRDRISAQGLYSCVIIEKETDLQILTNKKLDEEFIRERLRQYRRQVENYISRDSRFLTSLKPISVELNAPAIVKKMSMAAAKANVGPMAAIAGGVAEFLGKDLLGKGYREVIIENGGDIFLKVAKLRRVAIYSGRSKLWEGLSLKIRPKLTPLGLCTSSGRIGHSLSFGKADAVVILSKDTSLADAVATATANLIKSKKDLHPALNFARSIKGVRGAVIIFKNNLVSWGKDMEFAR